LGAGGAAAGSPRVSGKGSPLGNCDREEQKSRGEEDSRRKNQRGNRTQKNVTNTEHRLTRKKRILANGNSARFCKSYSGGGGGQRKRTKRTEQST